VKSGSFIDVIHNFDIILFFDAGRYRWNLLPVALGPVSFRPGSAVLIQAEFINLVSLYLGTG
jgi:hypothetical protein